MNYKVSIIVPVYNCAEYVERCIESLINQTYKNIEILLINDGSTDNSLDIINKYKNNSTVRIFNQTNSGANKARKNGIDNCTGDYVMFVDSDDWIETDSIEKFIKYIRKYKCDIVRFNGILEPSKKIKNGYNFTNSNIIELDNLEKYNLFITTSVLNSLCFCIYKKDLLNNIDAFDSNFSNAEDLWANLNIYTKTEKILLINETFYHYWVNENSTTHVKSFDRVKKNIKELHYVLSVFWKYLEKWNIQENDILYKKTALKIIDVSRMTMIGIYNCKDCSKNEINEFVKEEYDSEQFEFIRNNFSYKDLKKEILKIKGLKKFYKLLGLKYIYKKKYNKLYILNLINKII